jgi:hypothetical protein
MDFLKRQMFLIVCGVVAALGIALGVLGMKSKPKVAEELEASSALYGQLNSLSSQPVNADSLEAQRERIRQVEEDYARVLERAKELYDYAPLVPEVLPEGTFDSITAFRNQYRTRMRALFKSLNAGQPATSTDIDDMVRRISLERAERRIAEEEVDPDELDATPEEPEMSPAGVLTEAGVRDSAAQRAHIFAAQQIRLYAVDWTDEETQEFDPALDFHAAMQISEFVTIPEITDVWWAQVGLWIQEDVVDAIVQVNEEAADAARARGETPWVGVMAVKDLISIRVMRGYVTTDEQIMGMQPTEMGAAYPPAAAGFTFTGNMSDDFGEVVQFTIKAVMDQRDVLRLVDLISENSFHTLLRVAYAEAPVNREMTGKIYGSEPTAVVVMDFETFMLGDVFRPLMPMVVADEFGITVPEREAAAEVEEP